MPRDLEAWYNFEKTSTKTRLSRDDGGGWFVRIMRSLTSVSHRCAGEEGSDKGSPTGRPVAALINDEPEMETSSELE
jgi:hypothetical protein